jgi:two-component system CheB/CheR fusion protein
VAHEEARAFDQLVVIGASAGGIEALSKLVETLPRDIPAPIVVAQHLDPTRISRLAEILATRSSLPVRTIVGRMDLEPGTIYLVPSNTDVEVTDHAVTSHVVNGDGPVPSIDLLFTTAASVFGENLIAVILTGSGSDGAAGARDVKAAGGTVVIQNPATAAHPTMPLSLSPSIVDVIADLENLGDVLSQLLAGEYTVAEHGTDARLRALLDQLRERSGIDFAAYKLPTIMRRLQRRMTAAGTTNLDEYARFIDRNPQEYDRLVNAFLIKVTSFFRDTELFDYLREVVLPDIIEHSQERNEIRIWSAGCATGEEAYSLAMLVRELLDDDLDRVNVRIFATDLDADAVAFARRGTYPATALANVAPERIERHFFQHDGSFEVRKSVRSLVVFGQHDLGQRAPFPRIDLVLCRNVLIYFTAELQKRALQLFAFALRDGGYLFLGKAESVSPLPGYFELDHPRLKAYRRIGERVAIPAARLSNATLIPPRVPTTRQSPVALDVALGRTGREGANARAGSVDAEAILMRVPVGIVVVNEQYIIQIINTVARRLLGIHTVAIGEDFVHVAQNIPLGVVRSAIDQAFHAQTATHTFPLEADGSTSSLPTVIEVSCYPQPVEAEHRDIDLVMIVLTDVTTREMERQRGERYASQIERLEQSNRNLVRANESLALANTELRNMIEELLVNNEEVQSATEEVETLNEELQATNEELETLNEELQATVEELNTTNDDLQARNAEFRDLAVSLEAQRRTSEIERSRVEAILDSMGDAVIVLDESGREEIANQAFRAMFGSLDRLQPLDEVGHPLPEDSTPLRRAARGEAFTMTFVAMTASGDIRRLEATGRPVAGILDRAGAVVAIRDISKRAGT